jgi:hypothetical protein
MYVWMISTTVRDPSFSILVVDCALFLWKKETRMGELVDGPRNVWQASTTRRHVRTTDGLCCLSSRSSLSELTFPTFYSPFSIFLFVAYT